VNWRKGGRKENPLDERRAIGDNPQRLQPIGRKTTDLKIGMRWRTLTRGKKDIIHQGERGSEAMKRGEGTSGSKGGPIKRSRKKKDTVDPRTNIGGSRVLV